jgi:hypothetical protein
MTGPEAGGPAAGGAIEYRAPWWWSAAGLALVAAAVAGWLLAGASVGFVAASAGVGAVTLFVARRAWVRVDAEGVALRPNGLRAVVAPWPAITGVAGHRVVLAGGRRVTVPPLAGDPLAHIEAELTGRAGVV